MNSSFGHLPPKCAAFVQPLVDKSIFFPLPMSLFARWGARTHECRIVGNTGDGSMTVTYGALFALALGTCALPAMADDGLADRLGSLLGQERQTLEVVPARQLAALTAAPALAPAAAPAAAAVQPAAAQPAPVEAATVAAATAAPLAEMVAAAAPAGGSEWECLTEALYFEARGESLRGIAAVAEVILNRRDSGAYPGTICGVVNQANANGCQFTYTCDGLSDAIHDRAAWARVGQVARAMMDGAPRTLTGGATHYHTTAVSPSWAARFPRTAQIGPHLFYRQPVRTASN